MIAGFKQHLKKKQDAMHKREKKQSVHLVELTKELSTKESISEFSYPTGPLFSRFIIVLYNTTKIVKCIIFS